MLYFFKYFERKDKQFLFFIYFITIIWVAINSSQWLLIGKLTDTFVKVQNTQNISYNDSILYALMLFGFIILCNVIGFSLKFVTRCLTTKISLTLAFRIRNNLYNSFIYSKEKEISKIGISSLNNRLTNDLNELQNAIMNLFVFAFERCLMFVFCVIFSLILSPILCLIYPILIVVVIVFAYIADKKAYKSYYQANEALDGTNKTMRENIVGNKIIRSFGLLKHHYKRFNVYNQKWYKAILAGENWLYLTFVFILFLLNTLTVFLLIIGGVVNYNIYFQNIGGNIISVGVIVAFINYLWEIIYAISGMLEVYVSLVRIKPITKRLRYLFNVEKENISLAPINKLDKYTIKIDNLSFKYESEEQYALENISLEFQQNKIYGLIGTTGSGKSTLINLLCNFYEPSVGTIKIGDKDYKCMSDSEIRRNISIAFQEKFLYHGTFKENILMGKEDANEQEVIKALKQSQAYEFVMNNVDKIDGFVAEKGSNLSGGQKQRISLARAFIKDSNILILDDSLSALDNVTRDKIVNVLKKDFKDKTIIIAGQQIKSLSFADKIFVFEKGKIESSGTHNQLLKSSSLYKKIYESQKTIGE